VKILLLILMTIPMSGCVSYYKFSDWAEKTFDPDFTNPQIEGVVE